MGQLGEWAKELADHLLRDGWSADTRNELAGLQLFLDVVFGALRRMRTLDAHAREDASYLYGRATMALDLGQFAVARRELLRLEELKKTHADKPA